MKNRNDILPCKETEAVESENACHFWGWILFLACAVLFIVSGARNRDWFTFAGSILFLVACLLFLVPLLKKMRNGSEIR
jgi:hypothetical protein